MWRALIPNLFTTVNVLGGVVGICLCVDGRPFAAGISVMLGYLFGDTLDGFIARRLKVSGQFGAEYDTIADHLSHVIAPAAIVYTVYKDKALLPAPWDHVLAIALAACMIVAVSIRHARNIVEPVNYKGVWVGLPRSVLGFWAIAYCNAALAPYAPGGWWLGVVLIPLLSIATLTYLPFPSHRLARTHRFGVFVVSIGFFASTFASLVFKPEFTFDVLFFWMTGYSFSSWLSLTSEERADYRRVVAEARGLTTTPTSPAPTAPSVADREGPASEPV